MKRKINALSFTPKYDELEDRIRLSINYDDYENRVDFMMTRSFVIKLFPVFEEYLYKFYESELPMVELPQKASELKEQDSNLSVSDGSNLELYKQEDELLLEIQFSYVKESKNTHLQFLSKSTVASVNLDEKSIKQIFSIIKATVPFFSWGISQNF